jgi:Mrp family chromosome partitioning ATPase
MSDKPLTILAVASGKGGVGKTMLTVAAAHELSLATPTINRISRIGESLSASSC